MALNFKPSREKLKRAVYPIISLLFLLLIIGVMAWSILFLTQIINQSLELDTTAAEKRFIKLDLESAAILQKRFTTTTAVIQATTTATSTGTTSKNQ